MKCNILGQNVKVLARALHALARVGDDLFIDMIRDRLLLRTVNSTQSAFAEFIFLNRFFTFYNLETDYNDEPPKCKISMKSFLTVFKTPNSMDRMIDGCELSFEPDASQLILKIQFSNGSTKTHFLPIIECESLQVKYKKNVPYKITASAKLLTGAVKNFRVNEDEITLSVSPQKTFLKTHVDTNTESSKIVHTELCLLAGEFEYYNVGNPLSITFCLKQLRAVMMFAESTSLPITILFDTPGRPVLFCVSNEAIYEGNFVVSSLSNSDSQVTSSQESDSSGRISSNQPAVINRVKPALTNKTVNTLESDAKTQLVSSCATSLSSASKNRRQSRDDENMDFEFDCSNNCNDAMDCNDVDNQRLSMNESNFDYSLMNKVFGRGFQLSSRPFLAVTEKVLAYDSDGLEFSD
ncbi:hypothetical protein LSTR_LSTR005543 [Laodelphax striatellus]|uniref:Cell cycle checkpoint control protein n=1 Tax=Laodelphax striatellus TaxID=195883 RepID=A0A482WXY9_LAOST|nr:hypothetical protein LSTR_LSTR005543 [Laodelphax striatellus]